MSNFQTILVSVFMAFFIFAVLIFSGLLKLGGSSSSAGTPQGKVVVWGPFDNTPEFLKVFENITEANQGLSITYVKKSQNTYQEDLIESFAKGTGPDLFIISPDMILQNDSFVFKIPYASFPEKTFRDTFIDGADIYLASDGIVGFPIVVDPMVLYFNKNMFSNEGLAKPPEYWDELFNLSGRLTKKKDDGTIETSMIALGRFDNITHAKDILATLLFQSSNPIIKVANKLYTPTLNESTSISQVSPVEQILSFFIEFSNPSRTAYSWNRSLPNSIDMFTGGRLAMYLGRASELFKIESVNPNLSFDVAPMLQTRGASNKRTYGAIHAVAVNKKSANIAAAFGLAGMLSGGDPAKNLGVAVSLPPASRALLTEKPADPYMFTFFNSALVSRSWPDPDTKGTDAVFGELIENILSNKLQIDQAINKANGQLESLLRQ